MYIEIIRQEDDFSREVFSFYVRDENTFIKYTLNEFSQETRVSKRHKWVVGKSYHRHNSSRFNRLTRADVILTDDILAEVKEKIYNSIVFVE